MTIRKINGRSRRIPLLDAEGLSPAQQRVYEKVVSGPRGMVVGPLRAALHNPELASRWSDLGEQLRYRTSLTERQRELAIIMVARYWNSNTEWAIHAAIARKAGLAEHVILAIRDAEPPWFDDSVEGLFYEFTRQLLACGQVADEVYDALYAQFDAIWMVELTALIGYYSMVAMSLNAHHIPVPDGAGPGLPAIGTGMAAVTPLPPLPEGACLNGGHSGPVLAQVRGQLP